MSELLFYRVGLAALLLVVSLHSIREGLSSCFRAEPERASSSASSTGTALRKGLSQSARHQWCPFAQCNATDLCNPCSRRYMFVIATGRSASTTLQVMLDSLPGFRISGENQNALSNLRQMMDLTLLQTSWKEDKLFAWKHERYPKSAFACVAQQFIETINPPENDAGVHRRNDTETVIGFKTIRFDLPLDDLETNIQFLKESFPCSRVLVNYRSNTTAQLRSQKEYLFDPLLKEEFIGRNDTEAEERLQVRNDNMVRIVDHLGKEQSLLLDSTQWLRNISLLNEAISWLGFNESCFFENAFELNTKGYEFGLYERDVPSGCSKLPF